MAQYNLHITVPAQWQLLGPCISQDNKVLYGEFLHAVQYQVIKKAVSKKKKGGYSSESSLTVPVLEQNEAL